MDTQKFILILISITLLLSCKKDSTPYVEVILFKDPIQVNEMNTALIHLRNYENNEHNPLPSFHLITQDGDTGLLLNDEELMAGRMEFLFTQPRDLEYHGYVAYPIGESFDTIDYSFTFSVIKTDKNTVPNNR